MGTVPKRGKDGFYCRYVKRILDIICSLAALIVLSPVLLIVSILIRLKLGSPVLFAQERIGKNEKPFIMYKFRTMSNEYSSDGTILPDAERIGRFGKVLRASSIDELPSLFNILKGEMSVTGPRPLPSLYLEYYTDAERHRHDVMPGLSGLAQISGRNYLRWEDKFAFDLEYVRTCSFMLDVKIVIMTVLSVIGRKDVVTGDTVTIGDHISHPLNIERRK